MDYTVYDQATGRVIRTGQTSGADASAKAQSGEAVMVGYLDASTEYVVAGTATSRLAPDLTPLSSATLNVAVTLTGLTEGAVVTATPENGIAETDAVGSDGVMAITFANAGSYVVTVSEVFPHQAALIEVEIS